MKEYNGNPRCELRLIDPVDGLPVDLAVAKPGSNTVILQAGGRRSVYLDENYCDVQVSTAG